MPHRTEETGEEEEEGGVLWGEREGGWRGLLGWVEEKKGV